MIGQHFHSEIAAKDLQCILLQRYKELGQEAKKVADCLKISCKAKIEKQVQAKFKYK